jgi:hypothetical protein
MVKEAKGGHDPRTVSDIMHLRLVVVTDSSAYLSSTPFCSNCSFVLDANLFKSRLPRRRNVPKLCELE